MGKLSDLIRHEKWDIYERQMMQEADNRIRLYGEAANRRDMIRLPYQRELDPCDDSYPPDQDDFDQELRKVVKWANKPPSERSKDVDSEHGFPVYPGADALNDAVHRLERKIGRSERLVLDAVADKIDRERQNAQEQLYRDRYMREFRGESPSGSRWAVPPQRTTGNTMPWRGESRPTVVKAERPPIHTPAGRNDYINELMAQGIVTKDQLRRLEENQWNQ